MSWRIVEGDCRDAMAAMPAASADAIVCDPPYSLSFMARDWDSHGSPRAFQEWCEAWATEALRVLKPGGHMLAFGGTRTAHRLVCGIEDAGFEIRDTIAWMYGSGFPKSLDVSKAIDKAVGHWRGKAGEVATDNGAMAGPNYARTPKGDPVTAAAAAAAGWGTALKPSHEPVVVSRKPLVGTVVATWMAHGTGAINVDRCRVGAERITAHGGGQNEQGSRTYGAGAGIPALEAGANEHFGRWPANVVLSHSPGCREVGTRKVRGDNRSTGNGTRPAGFANIGAPAGESEPNAAVYGDAEVSAWECEPGCAVRLLDEQTGTLTSGSGTPFTRNADIDGRATFGAFDGNAARGFYGDTGGASRFFYVAKADTAERNAGLSVASLFTPQGAPDRNDHPTVKPVDLMRWLVRLVTPPGGLVLDPFAGSGTTGIATVLEGFDFIGLERDAAYVQIARARLAHWSSAQESAA